MYMYIHVMLTNFTGSTADELLRDWVEGNALDRVGMGVLEMTIRRVTRPDYHNLISTTGCKIQTWMVRLYVVEVS